MRSASARISSLLPLLVALVWGADGQAQVEREGGTLQQRLADPVASVVAQAAVRAAAIGDRSLQADLAAALSRWADSDADERDVLGLVLLDSMIALGAAPPGRVLGPWLEGVTLDPALVLIAQHPRQHEADLLQVFRTARERDYHAWSLAGNLLAAIRAPRFARELLEDLSLELQIELCTKGDGPPTDRGTSRPRRIHVPEQSVQLPPGFPTYGFHRLDDRPHGQARLLVPGPRPIYWHRETRPDGCYQLRQNWPLPHFVDCRFDWAAQLLGVTAASLPLSRSTPFRILCSDENLIERKLAQAHGELRGRYQSLVHRFQTSNLAPVKWAPRSPPEIKVTIQDRRSDRGPSGDVGIPWPPRRETRHGRGRDEDDSLLAALRAASVRRIARAARSPATDRLANPQQELKAALRRLRAFSADEALDARVAILDAMIRTKTRLDPEDLPFRLHEELLAPVLILIADRPAEFQDILLEIAAMPVTEDSYLLWIAAGNMLVGLHPKPWVRGLVDRLSATVEIDLHSGDTAMRPGTFSVDDNSYLDTAPIGRRATRSEFHLVDNPRKGERLLVEGQVPVYVRQRPVASNRGLGWMSVSSGRRKRFVNLNSHRLHWLAQMRGVRPSELPFRSRHRRLLTWRSDVAYRRDLAVIRASIAEDRLQLLRSIGAAGLVVRGQSPLGKLAVKFVVHDHRKAPAAVLPTLSDTTIAR